MFNRRARIATAAISAAGEGVEKAAASGGNALTMADVPEVTRIVQNAVEREMAPVVENATNQEPWYRSKVTWGAIFTVIGSAVGIGQIIINNGLDMNQIWPLCLTGAGAAQTVYGRWVATKAIGR